MHGSPARGGNYNNNSSSSNSNSNNNSDSTSNNTSNSSNNSNNNNSNSNNNSIERGNIFSPPQQALTSRRDDYTTELGNFCICTMRSAQIMLLHRSLFSLRLILADLSRLEAS